MKLNCATIGLFLTALSTPMAFGQEKTVSHRVTIPWNHSVSAQGLSFPGFNRPGTTLTEVRVRLFFYSSIEVSAENFGSTPLYTRTPIATRAEVFGSFAGFNQIVAVAEGQSKGRELVLGSFDGGLDYKGPSANISTYSMSNGGSGTITDPVFLDAVLNSDFVLLFGRLNHRLTGTSPSSLSLASSGSGSFVLHVTYVYLEP